MDRLPSLLVFGSQSAFPSDETSGQIRQELIDNPQLSKLLESVRDLPHFWETLVNFDSRLEKVVGAVSLDQLGQWATGTEPLKLQGQPPTVLALPITVLLHITQYTRYLRSSGKFSHSKILTSLKAGGVQGFCVGFLSAIAVAVSGSEDELASWGAVAFRLAVVIGAYVDIDSIENARQHAAIAIRWRSGKKEDRTMVGELIDSISSAYVSSINDYASLTITLEEPSVSKLIEAAHSKGLHTKRVPVQGRFHTTDYSKTVEKLYGLASQTAELKFPAADNLRIPLRDTKDGSVVTQGSLTRSALENTLLHVADWYSTIKSSIEGLSGTSSIIAVAGAGGVIPASLSSKRSLHVVQLSTIVEPKTTHTKDFLKAHINGVAGFDGIHEVSENDDLSGYPSHSIAIVGMAGRFPGADSVDELWDLIQEGKTMVEPAPVDRLALPQTGDHAETKWWGNFLKDPDAFDHKFFKKPSREALAWDPQQRILLEVIYQALESASYFGPSSTDEPLDYGCYIGAVMNNYYDNLSCHAGTAYATVGTSRCYLSGCMSHYFGWTGPSLTIDTACSSSLVAINTACRAIWSGECSRAVAGGTNVISSPFDYQNLAAAGFLSPSGQCKPFDADADGYCRGEAVAVVVLKPLADAMKDNDNILGVVTGSAANQNYNLAHITQPQSTSQVELYQNVMRLSGVDAEAVSYVEAHGTGTGVGDPIEVRSIRDAFGGPQRDSLLHFSSIKGNIGHTEATAGVAGLIKVLLMMRYRRITAQASHNSLNPKLPDFQQHQMVIPRKNMDWKAPYFLACVNSYGAAGSNSAVMIRQSPHRTKGTPFTRQLTKFPIFISAGSQDGLVRYAKKLLEFVETWKGVDESKLLASLAFTLSDRGNHALPCRLSVVVESLGQLQSKLKSVVDGSVTDISQLSKESRSAVLVFGGQESNFIGLSREVYETSSIFQYHLDKVNDLLIASGQASFFPSIFESDPIDSLAILHSGLFAVQYASAMAWIESGLSVSAVVGHSFGQLTALCLSGALSLTDALKLVSGRASLMQQHWGPEPGSMLFLQADRPTVEDIFRSVRPPYAEVACYNGPQSHVVVGTAESIAAIQQHVEKTAQLRASVRTKKLNVTNGFHSEFTEPLLPHLAALAEELEWRTPTTHLETTEELPHSGELGADFVSDHTRKPVFFQRAVERLASQFPQATWLEAGRGSSVMQLVKLSVPNAQDQVFHSPQLTAATAQSSLVDITIDLWKKGHATQFWPFHKTQKLEYESLSLPPIQFEKTRHWLGFTGREPVSEQKPEVVKEVKAAHELLSFVNFRDKAKSEAEFSIDPKADRFQQMLGGHVMAGQALAPASLYFEVVARAALLLEDDTEAQRFVPTVNNLLMRSPIGRDTDKRIILVLKKTQGMTLSWSFSIATQDLGANAAQPFEVSTGEVILKKKDDSKAAREFERFETLIGRRRCDDILAHPDAENMQGNHIYRAFNTVVYYGEDFRGIKHVACLRNEAAGKVRVTPPTTDPADQRLCDTPMTDSFMQFAGFLVNYFNNPSMDDVFVCMKIEHIEIGGDFDPDAGEWLIYSTMSEGGETDASSDAYIFDARTNKMVMAAFGFRFSKMSQNLLGRMLRSVNKSSSPKAAPKEDTPVEVSHIRSVETAPTSISTKKVEGKRKEVLQILSNVTDIPLDEIHDESTLDDLGVDSLMGTEVLNDIRAVLGLTIDLSSFLFFPNIQALIAHVNGQLGLEADEESSGTDSGLDGVDTPFNNNSQSGNTTPEEIPLEDSVAFKSVERPAIKSASSAFEETRLNYDYLAESTGAAGFWRDAYSHQARLVLAYVVEAFASLGVDLKRTSVGAQVPQIKALDKHKLLVRQLYRVLEDGKLIEKSPSDPQRFVRTTSQVEPRSAESIFHEVVDLYPQHAVVIKLVRAVGSEFAACLHGDKEGIQLVFGDRETKKNLEEMYEFWPLLRTPALVLGDFLAKAFTHRASGTGKFRILEIGAGTGGTTRFIVNHLKSLGIDFEYVFTDLGASLVNAAQKQFKGVDNMTFDVLDLEKPPKPEYQGAFHCVLATNCVHATRDLDLSLKHARSMLRDDGMLTLIEITQNMFWLDIVVGLFEGWWLFNDGREHALVDEKHWERRMKGAGFEEVAWSDGATPESKTVRLIAAFPKKAPEKPVKAGFETVVYKTVDDLDIQADIYYPLEGEVLPAEKMPVALMIHGGSHMLFTRKDVRPAQTRLLLSKGFLPVSIDYRLCPEVALMEGPMVDTVDALEWAQTKLPSIKLPRSDLKIDGSRVVVVGWSSGGQLAMSLAWTAPQRGLRPPEAILTFYSPTDYEDSWWQNPIQPIGGEYQGQTYDIIEGVADKPIANYAMVGAWEEPIADPRSWNDLRCRLIFHINWKAQTLPVILNGLPNRKTATSKFPEVQDWNALPQPSLETIQAASPRAHVLRGTYKIPTFFIHGTADDLIPWQQTQRTYETMRNSGIETNVVLIKDGPHICDLSSDPNSEGWKAVLKGYEFLASHAL